MRRYKVGNVPGFPEYNISRMSLYIGIYIKLIYQLESLKWRPYNDIWR